MAEPIIIERTQVRIADTRDGSPSPRSFELSPIDKAATRPFGTVWVFPHGLSVSSFKESLSWALRKFPFLSARIENSTVYADDSGVELTIQCRPDLNLDNVEAYLKSNTAEFLESDFVGKGVLEGKCAVLTVVLTFLGTAAPKTGGEGANGFLVGVTMLHSLGDAASFFTFITFWSNYHRNDTRNINVNFRRERTPSQRTKEEALRDLVSSPNFFRRPARVIQPNQKTHKMYYLHASPETISRLKKEYSQTQSAGRRRVSTFACLCAHYLPIIFEGFGLKGKGIEKQIPYVINVRKPAGRNEFFFGNYFLIVNVSVTTDDGESELASKFHESIYRYSQSPDSSRRIAEHYALWESSIVHHPGKFANVVFENKAEFRSFLCNDLSKFGMENSDFGTGHRPLMYLPFPPSHFSLLPDTGGYGKIVGLAGLNPFLVSFCESRQRTFMRPGPS